MGNSTDIYLTIFSATIVLLLLLATVISLLFIYQNRQIRNRTEVRQIKEHYESEILRTRLEIKEQTLKNIAQEIHDNVGQILSLANLSLSSLELRDEAAQRDKMENVMQLISKSIADLRNLSKMMDPESVARQGLSSCLQFEISLLTKTGMFETRFRQTGKEVRMESSRQLLVYRIMQEVINNIIKHSKAKTLEFGLHFGESLVVSIQDDGVGFDTALDTSGAGLRNIKSRAKLMRGNVLIESKPGAGTKTTLEVPIT